MAVVVTHGQPKWNTYPAYSRMKNATICSRKAACTLMIQLRPLLNLCSIEGLCRNRRLGWFYHIQRLEEHHLQKSVTNFKVTGSFSRCRLRKGWIKNVNNDIKSFNISRYLKPDGIGLRKDGVMKMKIQQPQIGQSEVK